MNILMCTTGYPRFRGDVFGVFVAQQVACLRKQGHAVSVIAPHGAGVHGEDAGVQHFRYLPAMLERVAYGNGIPTNIRTNPLLMLGVVPFMLGFAIAVLRRARAVDVIHCHWIVSALCALPAAIMFRKKIMVTVRGTDASLITGIAGLVFRGVLSRMDHIVTVSDAIAARVRSACAGTTPVTVVANGIDTTLFVRSDQKRELRANCGLPQERCVVLSLGMLVPVKNVSLLVRAIPQVLKQCPDAFFVIAGDGCERERLRETVRQLRIEAHVAFPGAIATEERDRWFKAADLFVLTSVSEGRPNVALEAMACELPVVASSVGGVPEVVADGVTGYLFPSNDETALVSRLVALVKDRQKMRAMGAAGRARIFENECDSDAAIARLETVYAQVQEAR